MEPKSVESIAVLGAGVMGHGIAQLAAQAGLKVALRDVDQKFLDIAKVSVEKSLARLVDRGRVKKEDAAKTLGRISFMLSLQDAVKDADVIIEAIPEVMGIKKRVWSEAFQFAKPTAIFASNTSSLSITEMSAVVSKPENFIGMHFFNPPQVMLLVEVIPGEKTSQDTIATVEALAKKLGKTPVTVKRDAPGFIVNRILVTYLNEAAKLLDQGFTKEQVDAGMQFNAGMPMGPFMLSDLIGIDIVHNIIKVFENNLGVAYKVAEPITKLFEQNKFGRKSGEGFYNYAEKPTVTEQDIKGFDPGALINSMISEAEKLVKDGVADIQSIDLAVKLGANVPWGPFELKKKNGKWSRANGETYRS
jgi:enoyl-CoA hydratase/3-hydroxyacyl-CoA dehydrogenase